MPINRLVGGEVCGSATIGAPPSPASDGGLDCSDRLMDIAAAGRDNPSPVRVFLPKAGEVGPDTLEVTSMQVDGWDASLEVVNQPVLGGDERLDAGVVRRGRCHRRRVLASSRSG